jgi:Phage head-tail joining protein
MSYRYPVKISNGVPTIVDPGSLRHSIAILQQLASGSFDESGASAAYQPFLPQPGDEILSAIEPVRGVDVSKNGQTTTQLTVWVTLWFVSGILPNMRVVAPNGSIYIIQAIDNVLEMDRILVLWCLGLGPNV